MLTKYSSYLTQRALQLNENPNSLSSTMQEPLTIDHISGPLALLGIGYCLASVIFIYEMFIKYWTR